jgi:hemerythrin-like domain-containing protein
MTATADLRSEHGGVDRMLRIMDGMAERVRAGERADPDALAEVIEFLRVFVDQCHHTKEEQLLFPALRAAGITSVEATIETLLAEHAQGRATVARIVAAAASPADGADAVQEPLAEVLGEYTQLLRAHIRREEGDCFSVADRELPAAVQIGLNEGYDRIESEVVGEGRHEAFHAMLDRLAAVYLD